MVIPIDRLFATCMKRFYDIRKRSSAAGAQTTRAMDVLPTEIILQVALHLDILTLYHLSLVSRKYRNILARASRLWYFIHIDPCLPFDSRLLHSALCFLVTFQRNTRIRSARFDHAPIEDSTLESILFYLPNLTHLSLIECPRIDCWKILRILKIATPSNRFLQHLTRLEIRGNFPSERGYRTFAMEMYCYGEIKRILSGLRNDGKSVMHELSETQYSLYQFWLVLRSRLEQADFRPVWLPDAVSQFIRLTEETTSSTVQVDLQPCPLCYRNVATADQYRSCKVCGIPAPSICSQCMCLQCGDMLCFKCNKQLHNNGGGRPEGPTREAMAVVAAVATATSPQRDIIPWRVIQCRRCHISRRVCGSPGCQAPFLAADKRFGRWYCSPCKEHRKGDRWKLKSRLLYRREQSPSLLM